MWQTSSPFLLFSLFFHGLPLSPSSFTSAITRTSSSGHCLPTRFSQGDSDVAKISSHNSTTAQTLASDGEKAHRKRHGCPKLKLRSPTLLDSGSWHQHAKLVLLSISIPSVSDESSQRVGMLSCAIEALDLDLS